MRNRLKARKNILEYFRAKWKLLFQIAKFMYCYHNSLLPPLFRNLFPTSSQIHVYSTRTANNHRAYHCRTNLSKITILYQDPKIWKSLPGTITSLTSFPNFKKLAETDSWPTDGRHSTDSRPTGFSGSSSSQLPKS